jgi:hypothetical protein
MGKVIHVSDELHARIKRYCEKNKVAVKEWADSALSVSMDVGRMPSKPEPVEKKKTSPAGGADASSVGPHPWELPPFWERGQRINQEESGLEEPGPEVGEGSKPGEIIASIIEDHARRPT